MTRERGFASLRQTARGNTIAITYHYAIRQYTIYYQSNSSAITNTPVAKIAPSLCILQSLKLPTPRHSIQTPS
jgi:hypothetical protein